MAEYEGFLEIEEPAIIDLCDVMDNLIEDVAKLVGQ